MCAEGWLKLAQDGAGRRRKRVYAVLYNSPGELRIYSNMVETTAQNMFIGEVAAVPTDAVRNVFADAGVKGGKGFKVTHAARGIVETLAFAAPNAEDARVWIAALAGKAPALAAAADDGDGVPVPDGERGRRDKKAKMSRKKRKRERRKERRRRKKAQTTRARRRGWRDDDAPRKDGRVRLPKLAPPSAGGKSDGFRTPTSASRRTKRRGSFGRLGVAASAPVFPAKRRAWRDDSSDSDFA